METYGGDIYVDGQIVLDSISRNSISGVNNLHVGITGVVMMNGICNSEALLLATCKEAKDVNDGHWVYMINLTGSSFQFTSGTITIPSNCSIISEGDMYMGNADLNLEGYWDISAPMIIDGNLIVQPGALVAIGARVSVEGTLENYGEIAIVSGVDDFNGVLCVKNPQNYKDVRNADQGRVIVAAKAGSEYPSHALVNMDVNSFMVEFLQEDGKFYWILSGYQYAPSAGPELPPEEILIDSGVWDDSPTIENNVYWEIYADGTLKLSGKGYMKVAYNEPYPWKIYTYMIKHVDFSGGFFIEAEAFSDLPLLSSVCIGSGTLRINQKAFANCPNLESVTIPASVLVIETAAFAGCTGLKEVIFEENSELMSMPQNGFANTAITELIVPESVDSVQSYAFVVSPSLERIIFTGDAPNIFNDAFGTTSYSSPATRKIDVYYPWQNETWEGKTQKDYNGAVNWVPYCYEHTYTTKVVAPDCINPGAIVQECSACVVVVTEPSGEPPQGHNYGVDDNGNPDFWDTTCDVCGAERVVDKHRPTHSMYRMYNPNSGEHFYTGSMEERKVLEAAGWKYEGVCFTFPATTGKPVYRLYDKDNTMEHLYTMDEAEKDMLLAQGWVLEGVAFNSGREDEVPQYRLHNPNATIGAYHFTASREEKDALIAAGWEYQGIGFYTCLQ